MQKIITYIISAFIIVFAAFLLKDYFNDIICKLCNVKNDKKDGLLIERFKREISALISTKIYFDAYFIERENK